MYITSRDPHPGRCRNYRYFEASQESLRCLDYDGTKHVCHFPPQRKQPSNNAMASNISTYSQEAITPWVRPENDS